MPVSLSHDLSQTLFRALSEPAEFSPKPHHFKYSKSQSVGNVGFKMHEKGVRRQEAKENRLEQLRQEKEQKEMEGITFQPQLVARPSVKSKSMINKVVIKSGKAMVLTPSKQDLKKD